MGSLLPSLSAVNRATGKRASLGRICVWMVGAVSYTGFIFGAPCSHYSIGRRCLEVSSTKTCCGNALCDGGSGCSNWVVHKVADSHIAVG